MTVTHRKIKGNAIEPVFMYQHNGRLAVTMYYLKTRVWYPLQTTCVGACAECWTPELYCASALGSNSSLGTHEVHACNCVEQAGMTSHMHDFADKNHWHHFIYKQSTCTVYCHSTTSSTCPFDLTSHWKQGVSTP